MPRLFAVNILQLVFNSTHRKTYDVTLLEYTGWSKTVSQPLYQILEK